MAEEQLPTALVQWMARIETKLDTVISGHDDHEKRIRDLETQNAKLRTDIAQHKARIQGWLIGVGSAGGIGAISGIAALFGG